MLWFGACHGEQVLVADDNPGLRHTVCELLRSQADCEVCEQAENGKEAIEKAQQLRPDLIVLDFSMLIMDGLHAARVPNACCRRCR